LIKSKNPKGLLCYKVLEKPLPLGPLLIKKFCFFISKATGETTFGVVLLLNKKAKLFYPLPCPLLNKIKRSLILSSKATEAREQSNG
jgi:hypothetical protein